jgi:hypothetical protein
MTGGMCMLAAMPTYAQMNEPPPVGSILDLAGTTINHGTPVLETVTFVASYANTDITFAFRDDPAYIEFGNVSLIDTTSSSGNLLVNGNFSTGDSTGWTYDNVYGASAGGIVQICSAFAGFCWYDGAVEAYDAIDQTVATTIGDTYSLSFDHSETGGQSTFSQLANGAGLYGIDILAYAGDGLPAAGTTSTPEPATLSLIAVGLAGLRFAKRRRAVV